jgi:hypothetical protein
MQCVPVRHCSGAPGVVTAGIICAAIICCLHVKTAACRLWQLCVGIMQSCPRLVSLAFQLPLSRVPPVCNADAYGLVVRHEEGWSLVYSGDTQPCQQLVQVGGGAAGLCACLPHGWPAYKPTPRVPCCHPVTCPYTHPALVNAAIPVSPFSALFVCRRDRAAPC